MTARGQIRQAEDPNVKARLESYSFETLRPLGIKRAKKASTVTAENGERDVKVQKLEEGDKMKGMAKSQRKNAKRRKKKREQKSVSSQQALE